LTADEKIVVGAGNMAVSDSPNMQLIAYALGSCIGLAAYDPLIRIGGLIHIMLPEACAGEGSNRNPFMFADTGLPLFFDELYKLGATKSRLELKMAGGASLFNERKVFNIGERNHDFIKNYIKKNNFKLIAETIGGTSSRTMVVFLNTGKVFIKNPGIVEIEL
jgi:chemotaxis protein CheD